MGEIFWSVGLVAGIIKCYKIAKRETTCAFCVYGLMSALIGILIISIAFYLKRAGIESMAFRFLAIAVGMIIEISGAVLGIIGLVEYKQKKKYAQGRAQAVSAIVICVLFVGLFGVGFYKGFTRRNSIPPHMRVESTPNVVKEFKEFNFKYKVPDKPWVELNAKKINPEALFALFNGHSKIFFMILAEKGGADLNITSEALAEISRANLESRAGQVQFSKEEVHEVNEMKGIRFYSDAKIVNREASFVHWLFSHNGYLYQLITFGETKNKERMKKEAEKLLSNFEQLEKDKIVYTNDAAPFGTFISQEFNYMVDLKNTSWMKWTALANDAPRADTGALLGNESCFFIIPFFYGKDKPPLEALAQTLLDSVGIDYPNKEIKNLKSIKLKKAGLDGLSFDYSSVVDGTAYLYRYRILRGDQYGYLVAYWTSEGNPGIDSEAKQVFDAVKFETRKPHSMDFTKLTEQGKEAQAHHNNNLGVVYYNAKQYPKSLRFFKIAAKMNPENIVFFKNIFNTFHQLEQYREGLEFMDKLSSTLKEEKSIRSWKGSFLKLLHRPKEAIAVFQRLFSENYREDDDFILYVNLLANEQKWDQAAGAFKKYLKGMGSLRLRLEQAHLLYRQGKYKKSIELLKKQQSNIPFNAELAYHLIDNYEALGEYKNALDICDRLIEKGFASRDSYYSKARMEYYLKWYRKAKKSFEKALSYSPNDKDIQKDIKYVSGILGEGTNTPLKTPIPAVPLPGIIEKKLPPLTAGLPGEGYGAYYISIVEGIQFEKGKSIKTTTHRRIKVLDAGGASRFSTIEVDFDPLVEEIFVNRLDVRDKRGSIVSRGKPADYYVVDRQRGEMATYDQTLYMPVSNLLPGSTIELTYTVRKLGKIDEFPFYYSPLSSSLPVLFSARYYLGDSKNILYKSANGVRFLKFDKGLSWYISNPIVFQWEPWQVSYDKYLPMVWLSDAAAGWQVKGREYLLDIREKMEMEPGVVSLAKSLVKGLQSPREKVDTLAGYVQTTYTYKAVEFGRRALIPNKPYKIIANKYGDCKDHALLLHLLLKAVDIPSFLALVNPGEELKPGMPTLDQFSHMILYIPGKTGGRFIDTTVKGIDLRLKIPINLADTQALVLNQDNTRLVKIPSYEPRSSRMHILKNIEIFNGKELKVRETIRLVGYSASFLRSFLKAADTKKHSEWAHRLISRYLGSNSCELKSFNKKNLYNNSRDLVIDLIYEIKEPFRKRGDRYIFKLPNVWESYYLEVESVKERITPFEIGIPFELFSIGKVSVSPGFVLNIQDKGDRKLKEQEASFARWETKVQSTSSELTLHFQCELIPGVFAAKEYSRYSNMISRALKSVAAEFNCRQAGKKP